MPDSPGEAAARHGLKSSVNDNRTEVALASETIDLLRSEIRIAVTAGIRAGLTEAMNEQNAALLFGALVKAFQNQAQAGAGRWMFGRLRWTASNLLWFLLAMAALYNVGGWAFLKAAWVVYQQTKGNPT